MSIFRDIFERFPERLISGLNSFNNLPAILKWVFWSVFILALIFPVMLRMCVPSLKMRRKAPKKLSQQHTDLIREWSKKYGKWAGITFAGPIAISFATGCMTNEHFLFMILAMISIPIMIVHLVGQYVLWVEFHNIASSIEDDRSRMPA